MCGFAGFLGTPNSQVLSKMARAIAHRGPDSEGFWQDENSGVSLAHRRLAVIDLSPAGAQPMRSPSSRYVIVYNGEIYNHLDLRKELNASWRGHCDTETLLAGFDKWGIEETLKRTIGMFAFAVWDSRENKLILARDRAGEKPLYYGWQNNTFLFASELKPLRAHPDFRGEIDRDALALFMRYNCIPSPHSIYRGIYKLPPGCIAEIFPAQREVYIKQYWSGGEIAANGAANPFSGSDKEAISELESLLKSAVKGQMLADVPLGAFLSGGIDSSTIVALMQAQSTRKVKTFSIGFHESGYDEAKHASAIATHLKTEHTELYVTPKEAMAVIPKLSAIYDEPFADSSQIPTLLVSELARKQVTVSLSGDGGDELFGGYNRHRFAASPWRAISLMPLVMRKAMAAGINLSLPYEQGASGHLQKIATSITSSSLDELHDNIRKHWDEPLVIGANKPDIKNFQLPGLKGAERMMALDMLTYLPDDILVKLDRAAMSVSLEGRVPFLDHRVMEFALRLPMRFKIRGGISKWILRQILYRHVPKQLIERPKMGFSVPIGSWLKADLRDWAEDLLSESKMAQEGFLNPAPVRRKWQEHISGKRNWQHHLWDVLMFESWLSGLK